MSEQIYAPFNKAQELVFQSGSSLIRLSCNAEKLIAFLQEHVNEAGYVNLTLAKRREPDQYKNTHYVTLDTWKPTGQRAPAPAEPQEFQGETEDNDNIPF